MPSVHTPTKGIAPGKFQGDTPQWNVATGEYVPSQLPQSSVISKKGDIYVFNTTLNQFVPLSQAPEPAGALMKYDVSSFAAQADGTLITTWPDLSGNGFDLSNAGGAQRPTYKTNPLGDAVPAVRGDGVDDRLFRTGMPAVNSQELVVFVVMTAGRPVAAVEPWALGRAAVVDNAQGCTQGSIGPQFNWKVGCLAGNNLGGNTLRSVGSTSLDEGNANDVGNNIRRAYAFRWGVRTGPSGSFWGVTCYAGTRIVAVDLVAAPANPFTFTRCGLFAAADGASNWAPCDINHWKCYIPNTLDDIDIMLELARLRVLHQAW
jgi:hypothetical protein